MVMGVVFSLCAAFALNTGNVVQKHAVGSLPTFSARRSTHLVRTLVTSPQWMIGFILCLFGVGLQIMAFALAPIAVVQSIFNGGIVFLIVISRLRLGERLHRAEWVGIAIVLVALSCITISLSGAAGSIGTSGSGLRVIFATVPTLLLVGCVILAIPRAQRLSAFLYGAASGLLYGAAALGTKGASTLVVQHGVLHSVPSVLTSVYPYAFVVFSACGMLIYQMGLQRARISVVGTMSDVICSTYVVAVGMIVFGATFPHDPITLVLRFGGFAGVLMGAVLVAVGGHEEVTTPLPPIESDLGLGSVLVAEMEVLSHSSESDRTGD